jgi:transcriptional regulator with XRE-family HTH domain
MTIFSSRLADYRHRARLSQEQMGNLLGVTGKYVGMLERGDKEVEESSTISRLLAHYEKAANNPTESDFPTSVVRDAHSSHGRGLLKAAREAKGLTQSQLAASVGYSLAVYQSIEDGHSNMSEKMAQRVAKALDVDVADLLNGSDHPPANGGHFGTVGATPDLHMPPGQKARFVPLLSMAQCGTMHAYSDDCYDHTGFLAMNPEPQSFAVKLAGDSMAPRIEPGDVAVVNPGKTPRNGGLVLARLNDDHGGDVMLKLYQGTKDQVTLSSYNPAYPAMTHPRSSFAWIYPIASVTRVFD